MDSTNGTAMASSDGQETTGLFQCGTCKRQYKRIDHLSRHVRSHTQSKPYRCQKCPKAFARADLLKRHAAGHDAASAGRNGHRSPNGRYVPGRVTKACRACAANHLRCTEEKPCRRCLEKDLECAWDRSMELTLTPPPTIRTPTEGEEASQDSPSTPVTEISGPPPDPLDFTLTSSLSQEPTFSWFGLPDLTLSSGQWTPMGVMDIDSSRGLDLNSLDLQLLDAYNVTIPFELGTSEPLPEQIDGPDRQVSSSSDSYQPASRYTETFKNRCWRFRPSKQDHGAAEEHNLSLPSPSRGQASHESRIALQRRATRERLTFTTRDKILTTIAQSCQPDNLSRVVQSFPSTELLDMLLQAYLTSPISRPDAFIHVATFDPNVKRPELVAALAAAGACLTADVALTKLGLAIQECLRMVVPKQWESDNSTTRDLELLQAFLITLEIGIWSGRGRKVEIAESFLQPLVTMLRRDGKFKRSGYPRIVTYHNENVDDLRTVWKTWLEQESFRRLSFRALHHDSNSSMALLTNPIISYAETMLPFPDSAELWSASTPEKWRDCFLAQANTNSEEPLGLIDYLEDPEGFSLRAHTVDNAIVSSTLLSCAWSLAWECIQLSSLQKGESERWNALLMTSRRQEVIKILNGIRIYIGLHVPHSPETRMKLELIFMHLHMPFEDVQLFTGIEGPEQARAAYPSVVRWSRSEAARKTVWHAGQIIAAARSLPQATIRGPVAVIVYHASLALWTYGIVSGQTQQNANSTNWSESPASSMSQPVQPVCLDGSDDMLVQRFIQLGGGQPCIKSQAESGEAGEGISLRQPDRVMESVLQVIAGNYDKGLPRPHLVDNLIELIAGLQKATGKMAVGA